jgi:hypothetical protein
MKYHSLVPFEIKIPEGVLLKNGTMFVVLDSPVALFRFWEQHKDQFNFACSYSGMCEPFFLRSGEFVFGTSKAAVVETALRWKELHIGVEFYDCSKNDPEIIKTMFSHRETVRKDRIANRTWSAQDEADYRAECIRISPETYRGWWQLTNLPEGRDPDDWFAVAEEIIDPGLAILDVTRLMQERTFNDWKNSGVESVTFYEGNEIVRYIFDGTSGFLSTKSDYVEGANNVLPLRPVSVEVRSDIQEDFTDPVYSKDQTIATSPYTSLLLATETIAGELQMILDEEFEIGSALANSVDAHNLTQLQAALDNAALALNRIREIGGSGATEALQALKALDKTVRHPTVQELRDACVELDPEEYLDDYVLGVLADFAKHVDAEDEFDTTAIIHKALPPKKAD